MSAARPAAPQPLSGAPRSNFTPFSALGLLSSGYRGYEALNALSMQGLNRSTGLSGLGAGLGIAGGLAGAMPGMNPQVSGSLQAAGSVGSLLGQLSNPQTLQALRNFPSGGRFHPVTSPTGGGFATGAGLAGGALGTAGTIAGLAGAPPEASFGLSTAGTLAGGASALAGAGIGTGAAAGAAGSGAAAGLGLSGTLGLAGLVYLPGAIGSFIESINRADRAKFVQTNVGRVLQGYNQTPAVQNVAANVDRLNAGDRSAAPDVLAALESGVYAASRAAKNGAPLGITGGLVARNRELGDILDRAGMRGEAEAAAKRALSWMGTAVPQMLPRYGGLSWLPAWVDPQSPEAIRARTPVTPNTRIEPPTIQGPMGGTIPNPNAGLAMVEPQWIGAGMGGIIPNPNFGKLMQEPQWINAGMGGRIPNPRYRG